jgi:hypothetical protein
MSGGFIGFMLGTTANAMAVMRALVERYGPAPRAFLVAPIVGAFFIDFTNALIITLFLNLFLVARSLARSPRVRRGEAFEVPLRRVGFRHEHRESVATARPARPPDPTAVAGARIRRSVAPWFERLEQGQRRVLAVDAARRTRDGPDRPGRARLR